eukprot:6492068-Amphidinium_carterae.2
MASVFLVRYYRRLLARVPPGLQLVAHARPRTAVGSRQMPLLHAAPTRCRNQLVKVRCPPPQCGVHQWRKRGRVQRPDANQGITRPEVRSPVPNDKRIPFHNVRS